MITEGRSATSKSTGFRTETAWPPRGTRLTTLKLTGGSFTDMATTTEEQSTRAPEAESTWLFSTGLPLTAARA